MSSTHEHIALDRRIALTARPHDVPARRFVLSARHENPEHRSCRHRLPKARTRRRTRVRSDISTTIPLARLPRASRARWRARRPSFAPTGHDDVPMTTTRMSRRALSSLRGFARARPPRASTRASRRHPARASVARGRRRGDRALVVAKAPATRAARVVGVRAIER